LVPEPAQYSIHGKIIQAYALRDEANQLFDKDNADLHTLLEVAAFTEDDIEYLGKSDAPRAFTISSTEIGERFDSTNHIPVVRSAIDKLRGGKFKLVPLSMLCSTITIPGRFKRSYVEVVKGVPYLLPSQLPVMRPYGMKALSERQAKDCPEYLLKEGHLLVTTDGTVGRVHPVTKRMVGWFGSNNMARLWDEHTDMGFLYAFLSTPYGLHQLKKEIYGGVVDHINEVHIAEVLCPDVPQQEQQKIGNLVRCAFEKKDEASDLEDEAIAELENLISPSTNK
jgi:type I restriction enzyme S subunit